VISAATLLAEISDLALNAARADGISVWCHRSRNHNGSGGPGKRLGEKEQDGTFEPFSGSRAPGPGPVKNKPRATAGALPRQGEFPIIL
jgi:hypothetical protein